MTQQAMPNPVDLYEQAVRQTRRIVANVKPADLSKPTPCSKWNVQQLVDHICEASGHLASNLQGSPVQPPAGKGLLERYDAVTGAALKAAKAPGALQKMVQGPMGQIPGGQVLFFIFSDNLIHGWDLAKATGQSTQLDPKLVQACYGGISQMPPAQMEQARKAGAFGPPVQVPPTASLQDKLLGLAGRRT